MVLFVIMFLVIFVFTFAGIIAGLYIERSDLAFKWYSRYTGISDNEDVNSINKPIASDVQEEAKKSPTLTVTRSHSDIRSKMRKQDTNYCILKKEIETEN